MKLSNDQTKAVKARIDQSGITNELLRDDVLDHVCCVVEINMTRGKEFEVAVQEAIHELAPDGLTQLQHETVFLLNSTKIIRMKKVMYAIGLLSAMSFVLGWTFGMMHWAGARELSIFGFLGFIFLYVPMLAIDRYKTNIRWVLSDKLKFILGGLSGLAMAIALFFKVMHLPGGDQLLLLATAIFTFGFLPFLFFTMYKKSIS